MELSQNVSKKSTIAQIDENANETTSEVLKWQQEEWITYRATDGLVADDNGDLVKLTRAKIAERIGVDRRTLLRWEDDIPDFWERVERRQADIFTKDRLVKIINGLFLRAAKGEAKQAEMLWSHFGKYVPPTQQVKVDTTDNISDLFNLLRERKENRPNVVDAEVVHNPVETVQNPETQQAPVIDNLPAPADPPSVSDPSPDRIVPANLPTATHFDPPQPKNPNEWA